MRTWVIDMVEANFWRGGGEKGERGEGWLLVAIRKIKWLK
jgi:hypothetical protein